MQVAKLFKNGRSQAVRLPKDFRFEGSEVFIKQTSEGVLLIPKNEVSWDRWAVNLSKYDEPFMEFREQPVEQQNREGLNELFD